MSDHELMEQLDQAIDAMLAGEEQSHSADRTLSALTGIADSLRDLPDDRFKSRLNLELQAGFHRRPPMSTSTFAAIQTITPFISVPDGSKLIEFMKQTFNAQETNRHSHGPDGFVANVRIGDSDLLVMGGESLRGQESPAALHVYVKECDATYKRALDAGAVTIGGEGGIGEPANRPYGERAAFVSDPFGNTWFIATRLEGDYVGVGLRHVTPCLLASSAQIRPVIDFIERAFSAKVEAHEVDGHIMHAFVRIGERMLEMAEVNDQGLRPFGLYIHTDDVDAVYDRAVAAGGISILPPADQPFGDRLAIVQDPAGNRWFAAKQIANG